MLAKTLRPGARLIIGPLHLICVKNQRSVLTLVVQGPPELVAGGSKVMEVASGDTLVFANIGLQFCETQRCTSVKIDCPRDMLIIHERRYKPRVAKESHQSAASGA